MRRRTRPIALALVVILSGCSAIDPFAASPDPSPAPLATSKDFNDADLSFLTAMVAHQQGAIELAQIALDPRREAGPDSIRLALHMVDKDGRRVEQMTELLADWNQLARLPAVPIGASNLDQISRLNGTDFDREWMNSVVDHRNVGLGLIDVVHVDGVSVDLNNFASAVRVDIGFEISRLKELTGTD